MADELGRKAEAAVNLGIFHPATLQNFFCCRKLTVPYKPTRLPRCYTRRDDVFRYFPWRRTFFISAPSVTVDAVMS